MTHDEEMIQRGQDVIDGSRLSDETLALMGAIKTLEKARSETCNGPSVIFARVLHAQEYCETLLKEHLFAEDTAESRME
jgi:hypothetical protein